MKERSPWRTTRAVKLEKDGQSHTIHDIWISELGLVMISIFDEQKKVTINYSVRNIQDILPQGHTIVQEYRQSV